MQNVANDRDLQSFDRSLVFANRQRIEQSLCRVFVRTIARVDNRRIAHARQVIRRTGRRMPNHNAVGRHGFKVSRRVEKCLAFRNAWSRDANVHGVSRQTLRGDFERSARSRRRFKEQVDDGAPAQRRHLLYFALRDIAKRFSRIEQMNYLFGRKLSYSK